MTKTIIVAFRHLGQKCRKCDIELELNETVIATRGVNRTNYYHEKCHLQLYI